MKFISFSFHLRIPEWCTQASININGKKWKDVKGNQIVKIDREWEPGDVVELELPIHLYQNTWYENSKSVERGPITYALKIGEKTQLVKNDKEPEEYGNSYYEVTPTTPWNYGLIELENDKIEDHYKVEKQEPFPTIRGILQTLPLLSKQKLNKFHHGHFITRWLGHCLLALFIARKSQKKKKKLF